jgi:hypothetical protein
MDWQRAIVIGWRLLTRPDMERFKQMCEDRLLGLRYYEIFEDWLAINRLRDGYLRIKDGLVLEGEVQEMEDEENVYDKEPYKAHVHAFFLAFHELRAYRWWLLFRPTDLEHYCAKEITILFCKQIEQSPNTSYAKCRMGVRERKMEMAGNGFSSHLIFVS